MKGNTMTITTLYFNTTHRLQRFTRRLRSRKGMELVQVGILIAIAVGIGIIFKDKIGSFVNDTFDTLLGTKFS